jgi:hypothetical protein
LRFQGNLTRSLQKFLSGPLNLFLASYSPRQKKNVQANGSKTKIIFMPKFKISAARVFVAAILICLDYSSNAQTSITTDAGLFDSDSVLQITLTGDLRGLFNDRSDNPTDHPVTLSYKAENGNEVALSIQAKTRGHFRKTMGNCKYPPILLEFSKSDTLASSIFNEQHKLKLVVPCSGDDYVVREWMVYKIYNLVTPESFKARLVRITLNDTKKKKVTPPFYGFVLEEEQQMATRNHDIVIKKQMNPEEVAPDAFLKMAVFEYLIGNTDWSVQYQNIKIIATDSNAVPVAVPYDFDQTGLVSSPYAQPAEELNMHSVRERRYRGYCINDMSAFNDVFALYNRLKPAIYKLYTDCPLFDSKYIKETFRYFDEFYKTINDPAAAKKEFTYPCDPNGTGNVLIKGLKEN